MKPCRAFLKWAGGKFTLVPQIQSQLPPAAVLVEPFVGAASLFLNSNYPRYLLNDINSDLIALYRQLAAEPERLIAAIRERFSPACNSREHYLQARKQFNASGDPFERSVLFVYLNRHGFNGLCRYNKRGLYNVPFGSYKRPYFPEDELRAFAAKASRCQLTNLPFEQVFAELEDEAVVYCDPPYAPLSPTAAFTSYSGNSFSAADQQRLAECALWAARERGASVLISNHDLPFTRELYRHAEISTLSVSRSISRDGAGRGKVGELLALYRPHPLREQQQPAD